MNLWNATNIMMAATVDGLKGDLDKLRESRSINDYDDQVESP